MWMGGKLRSSASRGIDPGESRVGGAEVDADFHGVHALAHVELQLPAAAVARDAPELQDAGFGDHGFERDRHELADCRRRLEVHFHGREFFQIVAEVLDQRAGRIVLADGGAEEAELGGLADDQSELAIGDAHVGAFFHAERRDGQRLERGGHAGDGGHGALDADVVSARDAAANAHALAVARQAVVGRAARDGVHQIFAAQRLDGPECLPPSSQAFEDFDDAVAQQARVEARRR